MSRGLQFLTLLSILLGALTGVGAVLLLTVYLG